MIDVLFSAAILLSICAGLYAVLITYQLHKKYRLNYLSTYLYFQIFINVFGVYGILGQSIAKKILEQQESSFQIIESIGHFFSFLGFPFLIFAWYMFIRLCREIIEKYPKSSYAAKAKRMLGEVPQRYWKLYKITQEEVNPYR